MKTSLPIKPRGKLKGYILSIPFQHLPASNKRDSHIEIIAVGERHLYIGGQIGTTELVEIKTTSDCFRIGDVLIFGQSYSNNETTWKNLPLLKVKYTPRSKPKKKKIVSK